MADLAAYTDGACSGNPGPGGWGVVLIARDGERLLKTRELCGGEPQTTNNRMELMAAIAALEALDRPSTLTVVTDSVYVRDGVTRWIHGWKRNGWLAPFVPEDVATLAHPVLGHRLLMGSGAAFGGVTPDEVIDSLLARVPVPRDRA